MYRPRTSSDSTHRSVIGLSSGCHRADIGLSSDYHRTIIVLSPVANLPTIPMPRKSLGLSMIAYLAHPSRSNKTIQKPPQPAHQTIWINALYPNSQTASALMKPTLLLHRRMIDERQTQAAASRERSAVDLRRGNYCRTTSVYN